MRAKVIPLWRPSNLRNIALRKVTHNCLRESSVRVGAPVHSHVDSLCPKHLLEFRLLHGGVRGQRFAVPRYWHERRSSRLRPAQRGDIFRENLANVPPGRVVHHGKDDSKWPQTASDSASRIGTSHPKPHPLGRQEALRFGWRSLCGPRIGRNIALKQNQMWGKTLWHAVCTFCWQLGPVKPMRTEAMTNPDLRK